MNDHRHCSVHHCSVCHCSVHCCFVNQRLLMDRLLQQWPKHPLSYLCHVQLSIFKLKMDPPLPSLVVSFTGSTETHVCRCNACRKTYASCSPEDKGNWKLISNSRNTATDSVRWFCGMCFEHYRVKYTMHIRGTDGLSWYQYIFIDDTL